MSNLLVVYVAGAVLSAAFDLAARPSERRPAWRIAVRAATWRVVA